MTGCYGSSPEDRARERELNRHLASQNKFLDTVQENKEALWESLASPTAAQGLADNYELLVGNEGAILAAVSYARRTGDKTFVADTLIALIDGKLATLAADKAEEPEDDPREEWADRMRDERMDEAVCEGKDDDRTD